VLAYHVLSRHPAFVANSADAAFLYMSLSHLLWIVAYQCGIATLAALVIMACSGCRPRLWQPRLAIASMGLCAIAQAIALFTILSCQERQLQKERPFAGISLPQAARLPSIKDGWRRFPVAIQCNGRLSINEKPLELDAFVTSLQSAASNDNRMVDVVIGANVNASFDKVWPVLEACRSNRVWKVGFAVTDATGQGIGEIWAFLPHWESDPAAWGPLVLKDSVVPHVVCIGVQTNGFAVTERMLDANALNAYLLEVREEGGDNMTIIDHPGPGITHGQFMSVLCLCDAVGLKNVSVLNAPGKDPAR